MPRRSGGSRRRPPAALVALALALALAAGAPAAAAAPGASPSTGPAAGGGLTRLSDLRTLSRWAYPVSQAPVRRTPSPHARVVGHLGFLTSDGQAELYLVLASLPDPAGRLWLQIQLPGRPNGQRGWVAAPQLGPLHLVRDRLLIDRRTLRMTLFRRGRAIFTAAVGVGKPSTVTPAGSFYVIEKLTTLDAPFYGPYAIGTSAYAPTLSEWPGGGVVGIHGTNQPQLIPGRPSHGCVRLRNGDITRLWHLIALGTPIEIT